MVYNFCHWRHQPWGIGARAPSTSDNLIFSVHFTVTQILKATLYRCISKVQTKHAFVFCNSNFVHHFVSFYVRKKV